MQISPYASDDLAVARHVVTHAQNLLALTPADQGEILGLAWSILKNDHTLRHDRNPLAAQPLGPARIYRVPLAVFQAGRARPRRAARPQLIQLHPTTPGDAA